jgi:hypothetical protein
MEVFCPTCGSRYVDNERFCKQCGTVLSQPNQAQNPYPGQANTMPTQVLSNQVPPATSVQAQQKPEKRNKKRFILYLCGFLMLAFIIRATTNASDSAKNTSSTSSNGQAALSSQNSNSPTASPEPSPTPVPKVLARVLRTANLRAQPKAGDDEPVIGRLFEDSGVTIKGRNEAKDWFVINSNQGLEGWLSASLLEIAPESDIDSLPIVSDEETFIPHDHDDTIYLQVWSMDFQDKVGYMRASNGSTFLLVGVRIDNYGRSSAPYNPLYFSLKDSDGFEYNTTIYTGSRGLSSGDIAKDEFVNGIIAFEVPKKARGLTLNYQPLVIAGGYDKLSIKLTE